MVSAGDAVAQAERSAGVTITLAQTREQVWAASDLWEQVWERRGEPPVPPEVLRALTHAGNYLAAAYAGDRMVGALLGFYAGADGPTYLHSHILGVDPTIRARGIGFALKIHQRMWALEHGFGVIKWTYDPLVRTNGYFNIAKLRARGVEYLVDFYGPMPDAINYAGESDRVLVSWELASARVEAAAVATRPEVEVDALVKDGAAVALESGADGAPVRRTPSGHVWLCQAPADIVSLRAERPELANAWRSELRGVISDALARGFIVDDMTRSGWYVLRETS